MAAKRGITPEDLYTLKLVEDPQISPDGRHIAFVRATIDKVANEYRRTIWLATLAGRGRPRVRQFTYGPKADTSPRWSPDGQTLAFVSNRGDKAQIYLIDLAGGEARPLTAMRAGASSPVWSPDGKRLAFLAPVNAEERQREDSGKSEPPPNTSLEARHRKEAEAEREKLKADPRVVNRFPYRSGTEFFDDRQQHIYVVDAAPAAGGEPPRPYRLTDGDVSFSEPAWTADGRAVLSTQSRDPAYDPWFHQDVILVAATGKRRPFKRLTAAGHEYAQPRASPDGRWIAAVRSVETGTFAAQSNLALLPAGGGAARDLTLSFDRQVESIQWSADSRWVYFMAGDGGQKGVYRARVPGGPGRGGPGLGGPGRAATGMAAQDAAAIEHVVGGERMLTGYSLDRRGQVALTAWTPVRPADLYLAAPGGRRAGRGRERRLTDFNRDLLAELELARPEAIHYPAPDGREIHGWLLRPVGFRAGRKYPLVAHIHGGPHVMWGPSVPGMWIEWHCHTARGYAVFFCNPRGADGYGEAFADLIHNDWGDHVMHDILAGVDAVVARGFIDPRRMAVTGGSYAGYMTAWVVGHDNRFACAWAQRGLYNLLSFFGTTDIPQLIEREFDMLPFDDVEKSWRQSPLAYVRNIRTPLAIEHQDQDYRCPVADAEQLYTALKRLRRTVVFYRYPREGHEMSRSGEPRHRVDRLHRMLEWFDKYCRRR